MLKIIISVMIIIVSLVGSDEFTDNDMKRYVGLILDNKQKVFTISELVYNLFLIKDRGEFETKIQYNKRISNIIGDGIFFVYKKIDKVTYDIDNNEMKFYTPLQGGSIWENEKPYKNLLKKGYTGIVLELDFNNHAFPMIEKMRLKGDRYSYPYAYIHMNINNAKEIKNKSNKFFQVIAIKITPEDISKRKVRNSSGMVNGKRYLDLWLEVSAKVIGTAIVSLNPKKIMFAFGKK